MKKRTFLDRLLKKAGEDLDNTLGSLNPAEKDMIRGIVELSETTVKEIMVPRIDVVFLSQNTPVKEMLETLIECGHSRVPVYEETIDNVVGMLYVKDFLGFILRDEAIDISRIIRKPYFVPESKKLDSLLREFKRRRVHIAVAVDEYGGVSGVVCMEDIIEEIVGEIQDEFDNEDEDILEIGEGVYLCDARINIEDLNEKTTVEISNEDFDTLGGFVFGLFGKIPVKYEKIRYKDIDFIVQEVEGHKIKTIKIVSKVKDSDDQ